MLFNFFFYSSGDSFVSQFHQQNVLDRVYLHLVLTLKFRKVLLH